MKLATVMADGEQRVAVVTGQDPDLRVALLPKDVGGLHDLVRAGAEHLDALSRLAASQETRPLSTVGLLAPLQHFNRDVLCIGWNYRAHFDEGVGRRAGQEPGDMPEHPTFFTKSPGTVVGPFDPIAFDEDLSDEWDYEAEVAIVIGRDGRSISEADAMDHIFGYCVANDVSQRDIQRAHGGQWMKGKSIDRTMPLGPWITTADEIRDPYDLAIQCEVNAERLQDGHTSQMVFSLATTIVELSRGMTLRAGDLVLTGTPDGVGNGRTPPVFLRAGDIVVTRVEQLGELRNKVEPTKLT